MSATAQDHPTRNWLFAATGAFAITLGALGLFRVPGSPSPTLTSPQRLATVEIARGTATVHAWADPTPLFLPTQRHGGAQMLAGPNVREPREDFHYDAPFKFVGDTARVIFPTRAGVPDKPVDALGLWMIKIPFLGMGQADSAIDPLPERDALVEVTTAGEGGRGFTQVVKDAPLLRVADWQPMEFVAMIGPGGLVALPMPALSSNTVEVAAYFQNYLAKVLRLGERLPPGIYRIKVGP